VSPSRKRRGRKPDPGPTAAGPLSPGEPEPASPAGPTAAGPLNPDGPAPEPFAYDDADHGKIGRGGTGSLHGVPECLVCFAEGGGGHGSGCPNAGKDPEDWVTAPPDGWASLELSTYG
jgi:hypothetical protein